MLGVFTCALKFSVQWLVVISSKLLMWYWKDQINNQASIWLLYNTVWIFWFDTCLDLDRTCPLKSNNLIAKIVEFHFNIVSSHLSQLKKWLEAILMNKYQTKQSLSKLSLWPSWIAILFTINYNLKWSTNRIPCNYNHF